MVLVKHTGMSVYVSVPLFASVGINGVKIIRHGHLCNFSRGDSIDQVYKDRHVCLIIRDNGIMGATVTWSYHFLGWLHACWTSPLSSTELTFWQAVKILITLTKSLDEIIHDHFAACWTSKPSLNIKSVSYHTLPASFWNINISCISKVFSSWAMYVTSG